MDFFIGLTDRCRLKVEIRLDLKYSTCLLNRVPRKIRELLSDYKKMGATVSLTGGKGSHRKIKHSDFSGIVILSGKDGDDAKRYQEKDLEQFLKEIEQ